MLTVCIGNGNNEGRQRCFIPILNAKAYLIHRKNDTSWGMIKLRILSGNKAGKEGYR
jgi:hypothetical protein